MTKSIFYLIICSLFLFLIISCKKDNYDPPAIQLTGQLVYNGDSIYVGYNQVSFQLHQSGYSTPAPIEGNFNQNGTLSMLLFPGDYKLVIPDGQGPFLWKHTATGSPDTVDINISPNMNIEISVTPYYMIRNPKLAVADSNVTANFAVEQIVKGAEARDIEFIGLYINKTQFVSQQGSEKIAEATISSIPDPNNISLSVNIPVINPSQEYIFARIGVKIRGVEDMIYSPLQKLSF